MVCCDRAAITHNGKNWKRVSEYSTKFHSFECLIVNTDKCQDQLNLLFVIEQKGEASTSPFAFI